MVNDREASGGDEQRGQVSRQVQREDCSHSLRVCPSIWYLCVCVCVRAREFRATVRRIKRFRRLLVQGP